MRDASNPFRHQLSRRCCQFTLVAALGCAAAGCEDSISYAHIGAPSPELVARPVESVEVFLGTPPTRPHRNLGVLQVARGTFSPDRSMDDTVQLARATAARMGCEAILVTSIDMIAGRNRPRNVQANCIVYTAPPGAGATSGPCPPQTPAAARSGG